MLNQKPCRGVAPGHGLGDDQQLDDGSISPHPLRSPRISQADLASAALAPSMPPVRRIPAGVRGAAKQLLPDRDGFRPDRRRHRHDWLKQVEGFAQTVVERKRRAEVWLCARSICRAFAKFGWGDVPMNFVLADSRLAPKALMNALYLLRRNNHLAWSCGPKGYRFRPRMEIHPT
jgi:hypothetical protein